MQTDARGHRGHLLLARLRVHADALVVVVAYAVGVALFAPFDVAGDGTYYYDFTRRLVGDGGIVYPYQWGVSIWNAPFYLVGHALGLPHHLPAGHATGEPFLDASITVAAAVAAIGAVLVAGRVVGLLDLPSNALLLVGALFGTELWVYGIIESSYTHALDAFAFSVASLCVVRVWQGATAPYAALLGGCLIGLVVIRYANLAAVPGFMVPVLLRRDRRALFHVLLGGAVVAVVLVALPLALYGHASNWGPGGGAAASGDQAAPTGTGTGGGDLLIPLQMLFAPDRGLLAYAPLCGVGLLGFVLALTRPTPNRRALTGIGLAALGVLLVYIAFSNFWKGGTYSYGQRFLTSLTVVTLIGLAELARRAPRATATTVVLCTAWSLFIGLNFAYGWSGVTNDRRNADDIVRLYTSGDRSLPDFARLVSFRLRERFGL